MNVGEIKTRVKRAFGDEAGVQLTDEDIVRFINDGVRQMVATNEGLLQKIGTASSISGQSDYTLPVDTLIVRSLSYKAPGELSYFKLKYLTFNEYNNYVDGWDGTTYGAATPLVYTIFETTFNLFPAPNHSLADAIKIFYNRLPVDVANDVDIPDIPVLYHDVLVKHCVAQTLEMDEDYEAAAMKNGQIAGDLNVLRSRQDWKNQETYPKITVLPEDL